MRRFVRSVSGVSALIVALYMAVYLSAFLLKKPYIDKCFTLQPNQRFLFLGSSQIGCAVLEDPKFENKVIWTDSTPLQVSVMRLLELERRNQLEHVEAVCVNLDIKSMSSQQKDLMHAVWYRYLPLSLRYTSLLPDGMRGFLWYCVSTAHCPYLPLTVQDNSKWGHARPVLHINSDAYKNEITSAKGYEVKRGPYDEWRYDYLQCFSQLRDICQRNKIGLLVLSMPMLPGFMENLPTKQKEFYVEFESAVKALGIDIWRTRQEFEPNDYSDAVHMSETGALRFTEEVYSYLVER